MANNLNLISVGRNSLGTANLILKVDGKMRKEQKFCVYPIQHGETQIKIQSDTRIGLIDLKTGKGILTKSYSSGAYFHHLQLGEKFPIECNEETLNAIIEAIRKSSKTGENICVKIENEGKDLESIIDIPLSKELNPSDLIVYQLLKSIEGICDKYLSILKDIQNRNLLAYSNLF